MTRWPLLLPPPAVSTSPSRSRRSSSSIIVKSPSCHSLLSSCRRAVHRRSAAPSITVNSPSPCPSPLCSRSITAALALSLAVEEPSRAVPRRHSVPHHRGAVAPSLAVEEPSRRPLPPRSHRAISCHQGAVGLVDLRLRPLVSPLQAFRPAGCRVASPHAAASHLLAPFIAAIAFRASRPSGWLSRLLTSHAAISHLLRRLHLSVDANTLKHLLA